MRPATGFEAFDRAALAQSVPDRFATQVRRHEGRPAARTRTGSLTYAALDAASDRLAAALRSARRGEPEPVALLLGPGATLVIGLLAVWKAGKICVALDPTAPPARIVAVLEDSRAGALVTDGQTAGRARELAWRGGPVVDVDRLGPRAGDPAPAGPAAPDSPACLVYTSGSTGQPKGVIQTHRNLLHQVMLFTNEWRVGADDRVAFLASPGFILATWCILTAVLNGACAVPLTPEGAIDEVAREGITVLAGGRGVVRQLAGEPSGEGPRYPRVRLVSIGGETVYRSDVETCRRRFPHAVVAVGLGTTETGSLARYFVDRDTPIAGNTVPVGYPCADKEVLLLGDDGAEVAAGEIGEIAVRSRYLSPGYWRRPELTAATFAADPAGGESRLYRSGDLGVRRPDGCLVHLGRKDFQVKIRGFRVEVAEVEGALLAVPGVREAAVLAREDGAEDRRLVAYVVPTARPGPTVSHLRRALAATLPGYMVPAAFVMLDVLPLTANGKVNRLALPPPGPARPELEPPYVAPRTPVETALARIWGEVLGLERVGIHDGFLDLGGHSLLAGQIASRMGETFRVEIPLRTLLAASTIAEMAGPVVAALAARLGADELERMVAEIPGLPAERPPASPTERRATRP